MFVLEAAKPIDRNDPDRTIFFVPEANYGWLEEQIAKLSKKAKRFLGYNFSPIPIGFRIDDKGRKVLEVCLDVESIKIAGWKFVARIDHSQETGNIIRNVPNSGIDLPEMFRTAAPNCDHCGHRRMRRDTFVVHNEQTGEFKQIGSTCLADFLGHDAAYYGRLAEIMSYASEAAAAAVDRDPIPQTLNDLRFLALEEYLQHCAWAIRNYGWVSGKVAYEQNRTSTKEMALGNYFDSYRQRNGEIKHSDRELAEEALSWAQGLAEKDHLNDYEHNVLVVANASVIEFRAAGIAASIVGVYKTNRDRDANIKTLAQINKESDFFGVVGDRVKNLPVTVLLVKPLDTGSTLCKFVNQDGAVLSWFASNYCDFSVNDNVLLTGTIRTHKVFRGDKTTDMSRCKVTRV